MTIVRGEVAGFYNDLETSMMETIAAFAAAWPEYRQRVLEKFAERSKSGPLEVAILGEDLGALNAHVGTLLKDGQSKPKSVFHRLIASSARIDRKRIN